MTIDNIYIHVRQNTTHNVNDVSFFSESNEIFRSYLSTSTGLRILFQMLGFMEHCIREPLDE